MEQDLDSAAGRAGMVAVVGRASVGKSSLVNAMLGEKVSIVSHVPQTTRNVIRGILTEPRGQIVFLDTPGVHKAPGDLGRVMNRAARGSIEGVDAVMLVLDGSTRPREEDEGWMRKLYREAAPCVFALNKKDCGGEFIPALREIWERVLREGGAPREAIWHPTSAATGEGVQELLGRLFHLMPQGAHLFPDDVLTDFPRKLAIADVVREKLYRDLREELPHAVAVWIEKIDEGEKGWTVEGTIYVDKSSQKGIVIGEKGRLLRKVRRASEAELTSIYERPVRLVLWVKVEKNWSRNFWMLRKLGYVP
jgi:GTPase